MPDLHYHRQSIFDLKLQELGKIYKHIGLLCFYFLNVSIVGLFTTIINNISDYIYASLNLHSQVRLYKWSLDCLNITYSIAEIKKPGYQELDVFIPSIESLNTILKTVIFVDNINKKMVLMEYLYTKLSNNLKNKTKKMI